MSGRATAVLDVGKTLTKLSLWRSDGTLADRVTRRNESVKTRHYLALDTSGILRWLADTLRRFAAIADIGTIVPIAHGAAVAILQDGRLACPPPDYEESIPIGLRSDYDRLRDPFAETGSPALPNGLNLGAQLYWLESLNPELLVGGTMIVPWPQYWSWVLSGIAASEVTSFGCHTDLWRPMAGAPSRLAVERGWTTRFAPLRRADESLGPITPEWAERTGLASDVQILCGLHDSNAALLAARGFPAISDNESTVLSTGTWFVAMRTSKTANTDTTTLDQSRDCLINVDVFGKPVLSSRFMGGRELETLIEAYPCPDDTEPDQPGLIAAVADVLAAGSMVLPTFKENVGPFPHRTGRWVAVPDDLASHRCAINLYAALVADASLDLIGAEERILVEGRFAAAEVFVRALASLRPKTKVYVANADIDVAFGALRLLSPQLHPPARLTQADPLDQDLVGYRRRWRHEIDCGAHGP